MKRDRISEIESLINKRGKLSLKQLGESFPLVSQMTLRRDLFALEKEGKIHYDLQRHQYPRPLCGGMRWKILYVRHSRQEFRSGYGRLRRLRFRGSQNLE